MPGLILTLASLKAKADAAGVGTTATSTYPSLCPPYSTIPGYVTGGSSVVTISGTWANNQLVTDASITISKVVTSTETVYRNVSIGASELVAVNCTLVNGDIPASGGSAYARALVSYQYTTRTHYSNGTYVDGTWLNGSAYITGATYTGSNLGKTVKARTYLGTSTPSGVVAGATRTGTGIAIYQQANTKSYGYIDYTFPLNIVGILPCYGGSTVVDKNDVREAGYLYVSYTSGSYEWESRNMRTWNLEWHFEYSYTYHLDWNYIEPTKSSPTSVTISAGYNGTGSRRSVAAVFTKCWDNATNTYGAYTTSVDQNAC